MPVVQSVRGSTNLFLIFNSNRGVFSSRASLFGWVWFLFGITVGTFKLAYCERLKVGEDHDYRSIASSMERTRYLRGSLLRDSFCSIWRRL